MEERYAIVWGGETGHRGAGGEVRRGEVQRGQWRATQHAAILDAIDLFWREPGIEQINIFCESELLSTVRRNDPRISATLASLEQAVRDIYEEHSA
jgi:hypothetical protein